MIASLSSINLLSIYPLSIFLKRVSESLLFSQGLLFRPLDILLHHANGRQIFVFRELAV